MPAAAMLEAIDSSQSAAEKAARAVEMDVGTVQLFWNIKFPGTCNGKKLKPSKMSC